MAPVAPTDAAPRGPGRGRTLLIACLLTLAIWAVYTWPLPRHFFTGIPATSSAVPHETVRRMTPGDHLQLLYSYWLFSDVATGGTPYYYNLYEFNTGPAAEAAMRCKPTDDLPFSLVFTPARLALGRAAAWNLTGFLVLWASVFATWQWLRHYTAHAATAAAAALVTVALPYRWAVLLGGSPTGYAMTWVPILLWSIERIVRRESLAAGCLAAATILFAYFNDSHVFFFSLLLAPAWGVIVLVHDEGFAWRSPAKWRRLALAALPAALMLGLLVAMGHRKQAGLEDSMGAGRAWAEVALFSPQPGGLFGWDTRGHTQTIHIGFVLPLLAGLGTLAALAGAVFRPRANWRRAAVLLLLWAGVAAAVLLALGTNGPRDGQALALAREWLPPYELIRQPAKIYAIVPCLLAALAALALDALAALAGGARARVALPAAAALLLVAEQRRQVRAGICLLDREQGAYAAVAEDARAAGRVPRAMAVPLWPGDSAWSSLYQHYASLYHVRMLNGYQPVPPRAYLERIAFDYETANVGWLDDRQLDGLLAMDIRHLLLHEDAFPEQVSPFNVGWTLSQFLRHPRLSMRAHDGSVWAFAILPAAPPGRAPAAPPDLTLGASHYATFEPENAEHRGATLRREESCGNGHALALDGPGAEVRLPELRHWDIPSPALLLRARGTGELVVTFLAPDGAAATQRLAVAATAWTWLEAPIDKAFGPSARPVFTCGRGAVDLDLVVLSGGRRPWMQPGEVRTVPASWFFHAGHSDAEAGRVVLRREREPYGEILYGPSVPFSDGVYEARMEFRCAAPAGTRLGALNVQVGPAAFGPFPATAGSGPVTARFDTATNLPVRLAFDYHRRADMEIESVTFRRVE